MQSEDLLTLLDFILSWVMDLLRLQVGAEAIINQDYASQLVELGARTDLGRPVKFMKTWWHCASKLVKGLT